MLTNCPLGNKETHACWECLYGIELTSDNRDVSGYDCIHPEYKETIRVKPRRIAKTFCVECGKYVTFKTKQRSTMLCCANSVVEFKELYAICKECSNEVYVSAVNDINVCHRQKAYKELPNANDESVKNGIEILEKLFKDRER